MRKKQHISRTGAQASKLHSGPVQPIPVTVGVHALSIQVPEYKASTPDHRNHSEYGNLKHPIIWVLGKFGNAGAQARLSIVREGRGGDALNTASRCIIHMYVSTYLSIDVCI